jgi:ubiquinol-cytochrome c reductase cytochrome b subunit
VAALGAELGAPADPSNQFSAARPEWYFLFLFQFLKLFEGGGERGELLGAVVIPSAVMLALFLMPLIGRWKLGHRFNIGLLVVLLAGIALLTGAAIREDYSARWTDDSQFAEVQETLKKVGQDPARIATHFDHDSAKIAAFDKQLIAFRRFQKSEDYLKAVEQAQREAERVVELASTSQGIPFTGAITLLREDPKTQGPKLFARFCASCHTHAPPASDAAGADPAAPQEDQKSTAPNLYGFASRQWIAGLLNPKQIAGPDYFGNTSHRDGEMASFVVDTLKDWPADEVRDIAIALSAEAHLPSQVKLDEQEAQRIEAGRKLIIAEDRCVSCHKFHEHGELGSAPDLTDYGSREWLLGMISNPTHERFYRDSNDRMPAFADHADDPKKNMLSPSQLELVVDWLRGQWYEPSAAPSPASP